MLPLESRGEMLHFHHILEASLHKTVTFSVSIEAIVSQIGNVVAALQVAKPIKCDTVENVMPGFVMVM